MFFIDQLQIIFSIGLYIALKNVKPSTKIKISDYLITLININLKKFEINSIKDTTLIE